MQVSDALNEQKTESATEERLRRTSTVDIEKWSCVALRTQCQRFVRLQGVRFVMLVMVLISCVLLAFHKKGEQNAAISAMEVLMGLLFCIEIVTKVLANGWRSRVPLFDPDNLSCLARVTPEQDDNVLQRSSSYPHELCVRMASPITSETTEEENTYFGWKMPLFCSILSDPEVTEPFWSTIWNKFDFFIMLCCAFDLLLLMSGFSAAVFVLRPLKAFRIMSQLTSLQRVVYTLLQALPMLLQVCVFIICVFGVFSVLGLTLFVGKFKYCSDQSMENGVPTISSKDACIGFYEDSSSGSSVMVPRAWLKYDQPETFGNLGYAMMTLFELTSCDGWSAVMYNAVNIAGIDEQPVIGSSEVNAYFFIAFIFISAMFVFQVSQHCVSLTNMTIKLSTNHLRVFQMFVAVVVDRSVQCFLSAPYTYPLLCLMRITLHKLSLVPNARNLSSFCCVRQFLPHTWLCRQIKRAGTISKFSFAARYVAAGDTSAAS